jgi:hypothetical protein
LPGVQRSANFPVPFSEYKQRDSFTWILWISWFLWISWILWIIAIYCDCLPGVQRSANFSVPFSEYKQRDSFTFIYFSRKVVFLTGGGQWWQALLQKIA